MSREPINPDMELSNTGVTPELKPKVLGTSRSFKERTEEINPEMKLKQDSASGEGTLQEKESAKMPDVGAMPTGKKAANKATPGMG